MRAALQSFIADYLISRGYQLTDDFSLRAAKSLDEIEPWTEAGVLRSLKSTKSKMFVTQQARRRAEVMTNLSHAIMKRFETERRLNVQRQVCTVLLVAANPGGSTPLLLDEEMRLIDRMIRSADYRDQVVLHNAWAARPDDLLQRLNESKPQVLHFSGHGSATGGICLVNEAGSTETVEGATLRSTLEPFSDSIRLVVLNACDTEGHARALVSSIDLAIAMRRPIGDEAARLFAASLYRAIGFGRSISNAFAQGQAALQLAKIPEHDTPVLLARRGVDPNQVLLV